MNPQTQHYFWRRVVKTDSCWNWSGPVDQCGYGLGKVFIKTNNWITKRAHIISVLMVGRSIAKGLQCDHLCNNKGCVNPDHIKITTPRENSGRVNCAWVVNARKTKCSYGHELSDENIYKIKRRRSSTIERLCKQCQKRRSDKYRKQNDIL
jgi:hypothetical protein